MSVRNFFLLSGVIIWTLLDVSSLLFAFIFLAKDKNQLQNEMFSFTFGTSTFDLVLFGGLRLSIIVGACVGLLYNNVLGIIRLQRFRKLTVYYGCFHAVYVVMKIVINTEGNHNHIPERLWIMCGITLLSSITFYSCWRILASCKRTNRSLKLNINTTSDNETEECSTEDKTEEGDDNDEGKMNNMDKKEAEQLPSGGMIIRLFKMAKPDALLLLFAFIALVTCSISQAVIPYYTGLVVNYIVIDKSEEKFKQALLYLVLITLLSAFSSGLRGGSFTYLYGRYSLRLQNTLFSHFMKMEIGFFDTRKTGELTSRLTSDCTKMGDGIGFRLNIFMRSVVKVIGILFFMIKLSWKLSTVTLVAVPIIAIISDFFGTKYEEVSEKVQNALAKANSTAGEALSSMKTVRSFAAESTETKRYSELLDKTLLCIKKESIIAAGYLWSTELTELVMTLLILYYGGHLVMKNDLSGGNLVSFILYSFDLTYCIQDIGDVYTGLMEVVGASKKVFYYINRKPEVEANGALIPEEGIDGNIEFKNVSFAYPSREDATVLKNLSFTAEKGEVVALVGPSGSGKTSVVNLLQHFYEPKQGEILIDGVAVKDYNHNFLHKQMSLVQQEPVLFARTISENIIYGLQVDISSENIENSAKLANAHSFISGMPDEYKTEVGEKGVQLSGGQKQRVAIARALIRNPTILLLDEATSALDSESEHLVQQAINNNLAGRTVIVIAHRLSTVEKADKIIVIEKGEIVEQGKHQELIECQGVYAALVKKQLLGVSEEGGKIKQEIQRKVSIRSINSLKSVTSNLSAI